MGLAWSKPQVALLLSRQRTQYRLLLLQGL
jgi:hypothetical protein